MIGLRRVAVAAGIWIAAAAPAAPAAATKAASPAGEGSYFFCAMGQTIKYIGLFSGNAPLALAGAVGGGIACGMGW